MSVRVPQVERAYAASRHGQLHYRIARPAQPSTQPTLVCFHQSPKSGWDYEPIMADMARDRVVLAPDTPGYGGSDAPAAPPSIAGYAEVMLAFVDDLQARGEIPAGPVDLLGYHTGSVIATQLARAWPDRVRRLGLVGLAAYDAAERAKRLEMIPFFPVPQVDGSNLTSLWELVQTLNDPRIDTEWRHLSLAECLRSGSRLPWGFKAVFEYDFLGALAGLTQPTLVLCPQDDLWDDTRKVAAVIPHGRLREFPGVSHGFFTLDRAEVVAALRRFFDGAA